MRQNTQTARSERRNPQGRIRKIKPVDSVRREEIPEWDPFEVWRTRVRTGRPLPGSR